VAVAAGATGRVLLTVVAPARCRYCARAAATTDCALLVTRVAAVPEPALIGLRSTSDLVSVEETVIDAGDIDDDDDDAAAYDVEITFEETGVDAVNTAAADDGDDDSDINDDDDATADGDNAEVAFSLPAVALIRLVAETGKNANDTGDADATDAAAADNDVDDDDDAGVAISLPAAEILTRLVAGVTDSLAVVSLCL